MVNFIEFWYKTPMRYIILALAALPLLSSCSSVNPFGHFPLYEEESNIVAPNHTAADVLGQQLKARHSTTLPIIVQNFWNNHAPQHMSAFGRVIPEQISTRLIQLGFKVIQPRYGEQSTQDIMQGGSSETFLAGQNIDMPAIKKYAQGPHIILSGSYTRTANNVKIHARMTDSTSGAFIAAYDYTLPVTREIETLIALPSY
jgi:TolB-like protein